MICLHNDVRMSEYILTFIISLVGAFLSGIVGGGGSLMTAPYLIFTGMSPQIAVATTKFASFGLSVGALKKFWPSGHIHWDYVPYKVVLSIAAALIGPILLLEVTPNAIPLVLGFLMVVSSLIVFASQKYGLVRHSVSKSKETVGYVFYFITLILQSAFGAGVGILRVIVLVFFFGYTMLEAQATARTSGIFMTSISLVSFMAYGLVDYRHGIALLLGGIIGGFAGAHLALQGGNGFVKTAFAAFVIFLGILLMWRSF